MVLIKGRLFTINDYQQFTRPILKFTNRDLTRSEQFLIKKGIKSRAYLRSLASRIIERKRFPIDKRGALKNRPIILSYNVSGMKQAVSVNVGEFV